MIGVSLLSVFILSYFLRFTSRFPFLGSIRFELVLGIAMLIFSIFIYHKDKYRLSVGSGNKLFLFCFYVILSLPVVTWPGSVLRLHMVEWLKVVMFFYFIVVFVRSKDHLKFVLYIFIFTQTIRILEPLFLHLTTGYWGDVAYSTVNGGLAALDRLSGAPHDVVNPNQLAWVIVNMVPFFYYLLWQGKKLGKLLAVSLAPLCGYCLLLTGSRSGLLSLVVALGAILFFTRKRLRNIMLALAVGIPLAIFGFGALGGDLQTRYLSLVDSSVVGADTARGRIDGLIRGITAISNNPLFGNGLGTSAETNVNVLGGSRQITHNLYLEVLQEVGLVGFVLFMLFIAVMFKSLKETKRCLRNLGRDASDWLYRLATALQVWMIMHLFYSLSCFGLRSWEWYLFGGVATVCLALAREKAAQPAMEVETTA